MSPAIHRNVAGLVLEDEIRRITSVLNIEMNKIKRRSWTENVERTEFRQWR